MKAHKKYRLKKKYKKMALLLSVAILMSVLIYFLLFVNFNFLFKKSLNSNSAKYSTKNCLVFYPNGSNAKNKVSEICKNNQQKNVVYDYKLSKLGDYRLVSYENGLNYFIDDQNNVLSLSKLDDKMKNMIVDYFYYTLRSKKDPLVNDVSIYDKVNNKNISLEMFYSEYQKDGLFIKFNDFDVNFKIPLENLEDNFGQEKKAYVRPRYIPKDGKYIALTFDDGPKYEISTKIIDLLEHYNSLSTFFVLGIQLEKPNNIDVVKKAIERGFVYGSHTYDHKDLTTMSIEDAKAEILSPYNILKEKLGYEIKIYRPPYGSHNDAVDAISPFKGIFWNVDSSDWRLKNKELILNTILDSYNENDVILMHDIYETSFQACEVLIPKLISQGYQLVTVDELMKVVQFDPNRKNFYGA